MEHKCILKINICSTKIIYKYKNIYTNYFQHRKNRSTRAFSMNYNVLLIIFLHLLITLTRWRVTPCKTSIPQLNRYELAAPTINAAILPQLALIYARLIN